MINPTDQLSITLPASTWETVLQLLAKGPYETVAALIHEMQRQCHQGEAKAQLDQDVQSAAQADHAGLAGGAAAAAAPLNGHGPSD